MGGKSGPRAWHAGIKGMSSTAELADWFTKAGYTNVTFTDNSTRAFLGMSAVNIDKLRDLGAEFATKEVILSVNAAQIQADNPSNAPRASGADHFVRLASGVSQAGGFAYFRVWTWGAEKDMKVADGNVSRVVYGYVSATPPADARPEAEAQEE